MFKSIKKFTFLTVALLFSEITTAQCAMCKAVLENGDATMAAGVNNGITYLMVFPYLLIGGLIYAMVRYKKNLKN